MAGVALLGSPRLFMAKSSNFSGSGRKTVVTPQPPGCHHDRTPAFSAVEPLGPPDFSGLAFHTLRGPWSGVDYVDESINDHTRANPLRLFLQPQPVGCRHVASPA